MVDGENVFPLYLLLLLRLVALLFLRNGETTQRTVAQGDPIGRMSHVGSYGAADSSCMAARGIVYTFWSPLVESGVLWGEPHTDGLCRMVYVEDVAMDQ